MRKTGVKAGLRKYRSIDLNIGLVKISLGVAKIQHAQRTKEGLKEVHVCEDGTLHINPNFKKEGSNIGRKSYCKVCNQENPKIVKAYNYGGEWIPLTEEEIERIDDLVEKGIRVLGVSDEQIPIEEVIEVFALEPEEKFEKHYILLREALKTEGKKIICKCNLNRQERLAVIQPSFQNPDVLELVIRYYPSEITDINGAKATELKPELATPQEIELMKTLIKQFPYEIPETELQNTQRNKFEELIIQKAEGKPTEVAIVATTTDLTKQLEESLKAMRGG